MYFQSLVAHVTCNMYAREKMYIYVRTCKYVRIYLIMFLWECFEC